MNIPEQKTNWKQAWKDNRTGFHQSHTNPYLERYAQSLQDCRHILFPLCGKTRDMHYMHSKGHSCIGVELVERAIKQFFLEWGVSPIQQQQSYHYDNITIHHKNIFALTRESLPPIDGIFDRAALIALPIEIRSQYAQHLLSLLQEGGKILLVTLDLPRPQDQGPPFSVYESEIPKIFSQATTVQCLENNHKTPEDEPFLVRADLPSMKEYTWLITK